MRQLEDFFTAIFAISTEKTIKKGTFLAEYDKKSNALYFIKSGIVRYFYSIEGKEITTWFSAENEFVTTTSFFTQQNSKEYIIALENCNVLEISRKNLYELYSQNPQTEGFGRLLAEQHISHIENIFLTFEQKSATERYKIIEKNYPFFLQRVPLGVLASFLGMVQETLSRIRAKKT